MGNRSTFDAAKFCAVVSLILATSASTSSAQLIAVTTCGQVVTGDAELTGDIDCSAATEGPQLKLTGSLQLNGYSIKGNQALGYLEGTVVECRGKCTLNGPGFVRDGYTGVTAYGDLTLNNVTLEGNHRGTDVTVKLRVTGSRVIGTDPPPGEGNAGLLGNFVDVRDSVITNHGYGIHCSLTDLGKGTCRVRDTEVSSNSGFGIYAVQSLKGQGLTVSGNGYGGIRTDYGKVSLKDSLVEENGFPTNGTYWSSGIITSGGSVKNCQILGNAGAGVYAGGAPTGSAFNISGSTITGNDDSGVIGYVEKARFKECTVTDNCGAPTEQTCADLITREQPIVVGTTCNTSNYGVCSMD